ncbi:alpha/beta hydrolase family protein [Spongiimicrobium sp. 3-5]|uniref:alpha/beta hydrolase family protein n=1 Tax=Spongiimicrobium sp. 3-5 TaxID=3332596 RepID=UPI00397FF1AD
MCKFLILFFIQILTFQAFAQVNGDIIEKVELKNFEEFIGYIKSTESRDSVVLDRSRFEHFNKVQVFGITYWSDSLRVKGFLLQPMAQGKYPAIIYNRGGSLEHGSLTHNAASIGLGELARLANHEYVVVASQYRGNGGGEGKEEYGGRDINDVLNLIPLLESQPNVDASKLGMLGWSRGGMTTFLAIKETDKIKAIALGAPSTNLTRTILDRPLLDEWWSDFIPNYNLNKAEVLKRRSAIFWVNELPKNIPILLLQGEDDIALHPNFTLDFAKELTKYKIPYRLIKFEKGSHSLKEYREEVFEELFHWFRKYLR